MKLNLISIFLLTTMLLALANAQLSPCTGEEEQLAKENAGDRTFASCSKGILGCKFIATYTDGTTRLYNSPDGQACLQVNGLLPNGNCMDGQCSCKYKTIESLIKFKLFK